MYDIGDEEIQALKELFKKKKLYRYCLESETECDLFEKEFSAAMAVPHSLLLSSGTNSLILALLTSGLKCGDEVLIPAYTFVATASAVVQAGGIPMVVDIDENLSMDFEDAQKKITPQTRALILVHMDGLAANVSAAQNFCKEHGLTLIEDVAQALGASCNGKKLGTFGEFGCFSLNENKTLSCGEGGILITSKRSNYENAFCLHDGPAQFSPSKKDFFKEIQPFLGHSMRVSEIQGAIMRVQLRRLNFILSEYRKRKDIYREAVKDLSVKCVEGYSGEECGSSMHLQWSLAATALHDGVKLRENGLPFIPVTLRPAHVSWKWMDLLGERAHIQDSANPFLRSEKKYSYHPAGQMKSMDILLRTLRMEINPHLSIEETSKEAAKLRSLLSQA